MSKSQYKINFSYFYSLIFYVYFKTSSSKKKKEKERCQLLIDKIQNEKKLQLEHNELVLAWMESRKDSWFPSSMFVLKN